MASFASDAQDSTAAFSRSAQAAVKTQGISAIALVAHQGPDWIVTESAGAAPAPGAKVTGPELSLLDHAGAKFHSDIYQIAPKQSRIGLSIGPPLTPPNTAIYAEYAVDPSRPSPLTRSQPFHEINVAIYVGPKVDNAKLLLSTTPDLPLRGHTATSEMTIGDDTWIIVAKAHEALAGALTDDVPWILASAVFVIGLAMTVIVEGVSRRRDFAVALVAERTSELQDSLKQREDTQQALVANERLAALGQMAATVGHELRNPLGVLTNSMYLIRSKVSANADDRLLRQLDTADREIAAATLIVSDLLEFSRPRAANPVSIDVVELLDEAISVAPPPTGVHVSLNRTPVPPIVADRDQMRQVILNLLTNSYEAMPDGGEVRISAQQAGDKIEIVITDTGTGMDDDTLSHLFEPFFSKKTKGTGLGLAVCKRIIETHDGTLTLTSPNGKGCTAVVALPLTSVSAGVVTR
jgi:signal transduction histidine kinase